MDHKTKSLLYKQPHLYEVIYPAPDKETYVSPAVCLKIFDKFLESSPESILDIGCGTGRYINFLSEMCPDCVGVDFLPEMVDFAKSRHKHIDFIQGDMRQFRLNRTFEVLICMGSTFLHALSNADIEDTLTTFAAHSHPGTLLILDIKNCISFVSKEVPEIIEKKFHTKEFNGRSLTHRTFNLRKQLWIWRRTWDIQGQDPVEDYLEFRMLFPRELDNYLTKAGYCVLGMFDNTELEESDCSGNRLYVVAEYKG
jgi:SAM-dependent methyltransferase